MKYIKLILVLVLLNSCLTQKRFNKILDKGIEKGWVDTVTVRVDTVFKNKIDTILLTREIDRIVDSIITKTIVRDTCYDKKGNYLGTAFNRTKLEKELKEKILDSLLLPQTICLKDTIVFKENDLEIKIFQLNNGDFKVKIKSKETTINRPKEKSWFSRQLEVWYLWLIIVILVLLFVIKK